MLPKLARSYHFWSKMTQCWAKWQKRIAHRVQNYQLCSSTHTLPFACHSTHVWMSLSSIYISGWPITVSICFCSVFITLSFIHCMLNALHLHHALPLEQTNLNCAYKTVHIIIVPFSLLQSNALGKYGRMCARQNSNKNNNTTSKIVFPFGLFDERTCIVYM